MYGYEFYIFVFILFYYLINSIAYYSVEDKNKTKQYLYSGKDVLPILV